MYPQRQGFGGGYGGNKPYDKKPQVIIPLNKNINTQLENEFGKLVHDLEEMKSSGVLENCFSIWHSFNQTIKTMYYYQGDDIGFNKENYTRFLRYYNQEKFFRPERNPPVYPSLMCLYPSEDKIGIIEVLQRLGAQVSLEAIVDFYAKKDVTFAGYKYCGVDGKIYEKTQLPRGTWLRLLNIVDEELMDVFSQVKSDLYKGAKKTESMDKRLKHWDISAELASKKPEYVPELEAFFNLKRALGYFIFGETGSAKSSFMMDLGEFYYDNGYIIFDSYGAAGDFENCFWAIHPDEKPNNTEPRRHKKAYPCIWILPEYVNFEMPEVYQRRVKIMRDSEGAQAIFNCAQKEKRIICFVNSAYDSRHVLDRWMNLWHQLENLMKFHPELNYKVFMMFREIGHIIGSGVKVHRGGSTSAEAKAKMKEVASTCRHIGGTLSYAMDSQRFRDVFGDVRDNFHRIVIKRSRNSSIDINDKELGWILQNIQNAHDIAATQRTPESRSIANSWYPYFSDLKVNHGYFIDWTKQIMRANTHLELPGCLCKSEGDNFFGLTGIRAIVDEKLREKIISQEVFEAKNKGKKPKKSEEPADSG